MKHPITKGRLNKMLKYFRGKRVKILFEYNNSMGGHQAYKYRGKYDRFEIDVAGFSNCESYAFRLYKKSRLVFEEDLPEHTMFTGLGQAEYTNDGPLCYLTLRKVWL